MKKRLLKIKELWTSICSVLGFFYSLNDVVQALAELRHGPRGGGLLCPRGTPYRSTRPCVAAARHTNASYVSHAANGRFKDIYVLAYNTPSILGHSVASGILLRARLDGGTTKFQPPDTPIEPNWGTQGIAQTI